MKNHFTKASLNSSFSPILPGSMVALIAPSSPINDDELQICIKSIEYINLKPVIYPSCYIRKGYVAGIDINRAKELNRAFGDEHIKAIFCARGGYGAIQLLQLLDYNLIRNNPKPLVGYSDITALHIFLNQVCNLTTIHGPMPFADYTNMDNYSLSNLCDLLFQNHEVRIYIAPVSPTDSPDDKALIHSNKDAASSTIFQNIQGSITGGNLTVLASMLGNAYAMDASYKILFLEDVNEPLYKIDRALTSLILSGNLHNCKGIILGDFLNCTDNTTDFCKRSLSPADKLKKSNHVVHSFILQKIKETGIPLLGYINAGHSFPQISLPLGTTVSIYYPAF